MHKHPSEYLLDFLIMLCIGLGIWGLWFLIMSFPDPAPVAQPATHQAAEKFVDSLTYIPIEEIRVGMRVLACNPEVSAADRAKFRDPNPATWRKMTLKMRKKDNGILDIEMIRPLKWIEARGAAIGRMIELELPEFGAIGAAKVISIDACPKIKPGLGKVVISTFAHPASHAILNVKIGNDAKAETIGVTANHPFWSVEHNAFVPISSLKRGSQVLTQSGQTKRIVSILPRPGPSERVYNFEVQGEHVYYVGKQRTLVHNAYPENVTNLADDLIASSRRPAREGSRISRAVQSLQKKIDRGSKHFGTNKTSDAAEGLIRDILDDAQTAITRPNGVDIRDSLGWGIRITNDKFDTFLEPGGLR